MVKQIYEKYVHLKTEDEYFVKWTSKELDAVPETVKHRIYNKYVVKGTMLQRDSFSCQNSLCKSPNSLLTMHHVKWQKNGGEDKVRNAVTLCKSCHFGFHKARFPITYNADGHLPAHISGKTFSLTIPEPKRDWRKLRVEMKELRSRLKQEGFHAVIAWQDIYILMHWLFDMDDENIDDD
jgi:hypothetical protein